MIDAVAPGQAWDVNQFSDMPITLGPFLGTVAAFAALLFLALRIQSPRFVWASTMAYFAALVISLAGLYIGDHGVDWRWSRSNFEFVKSRTVDVLIAGSMALADVVVGVVLFRRLTAATRHPPVR